jgi:tetratricopeptide (TPR) repeat protein
MSCKSRLILAALLSVAGCNLANSQDSPYDDSRNPHYKQAQQDLDNNKPADAAADYEAALAEDPKLPGAQYQLGILYGEKLQDPVSSIFYFKRFLALAPDSPDAANARAMIDKESQAFAASLPNSPAQNGDDLTSLQAENAALKKATEDAAHTIAQLQAALAQAGITHQAAPATPPDSAIITDNNAPSTNAPPTGPLKALPLDATNATATGAAPESAEAGPGRTYKVVKGDSIWKIAHKMYPGDTKNGVDKIQEANKDAIGNKPLKIGQVLIIPQ